MTKYLFLTLICIAGAIGVDGAFAAPVQVVSAPATAPVQPFMATGGRTSQPIGHHDFCLRLPAECAQRSASANPVHLTQARWSELIAVNDQVNTTITPETDDDLYGVPEYWTYPTTAGDCEDVVLLKRRMLVQKGWPAGELLITVVRQQNGEGHAVLTVRTDRGDLVLDNLESKILVWSATDYLFVKRQSELDSSAWVSISDDRLSTAVGSLKR